MEVIVISFLILFVIFLFWAYIPDYKREPKVFLKIIVGMPIGYLLGVLGFTSLSDKIRSWTLKH